MEALLPLHAVDLGQLSRAQDSRDGLLADAPWDCAAVYTLGWQLVNMDESIQRILVQRALSEQHPQNSAEIIAWLEATTRGWNRVPTPFVWGGYAMHGTSEFDGVAMLLIRRCMF